VASRLPVAWRDVGAAYPHLELVPFGHELQRGAGSGEADDSGARDREVNLRRER
jgi:hypothetical protein